MAPLQLNGMYHQVSQDMVLKFKYQQDIAALEELVDKLNRVSVLKNIELRVLYEGVIVTEPELVLLGTYEGSLPMKKESPLICAKPIYEEIKQATGISFSRPELVNRAMIKAGNAYAAALVDYSHPDRNPPTREKIHNLQKSIRLLVAPKK